MKNKSVISYQLSVTSGNRARNTLSQLATNHVSSTSSQFPYRLWSGITVTIVTISETRSSCKCLLWLGTSIGDPDEILYQQRITLQQPPPHRRLNLWLVRRPVKFTTSTRPENHSSSNFTGYSASSNFTGSSASSSFRGYSSSSSFTGYAS